MGEPQPSDRKVSMACYLLLETPAFVCSEPVLPGRRFVTCEREALGVYYGRRGSEFPSIPFPEGAPDGGAGISGDGDHPVDRRLELQLPVAAGAAAADDGDALGVHRELAVDP